MVVVQLLAGTLSRHLLSMLLGITVNWRYIGDSYSGPIECPWCRPSLGQTLDR